MKRITLFLTLALMMGALFTACQKEESRSIRFYGTMENNSKILYDNNRQALMWSYSGHDKINIFDGDGTYEAFYAIRPDGVTAASGPAAVFVVNPDDLDEEPRESFNQEASSYFATHGINPFVFGDTYYDGSAPHIYNIPAWGMGWSDNNFPMVARSDAYDPTTFFFKHVFGYLKLHIQIPENNSVCTLTVATDETNGPVIGGEFMIGMDDDGNPIARPLTATEYGTISSSSYDYYVESNCVKQMFPILENGDVVDGYWDYFWPLPAGDYTKLSITLTYYNGQVTRSLQSGNTLTITRGCATPVTITLRDGELAPITPED